MRHIAILLALMFGAQSAWADDTPPDIDPDMVEEEVEYEDDDELLDDEEDAAGEDDSDEPMEDGATDVAESEDETPVKDEAWHDNRSARGQERGGHHGQVSTMAKAGLGPVFGKLRSQGYGDISVEETDGQIMISSRRGGENRNLVYDASTGELLSDVSDTSSENLAERIFGKKSKQVEATDGTVDKAKTSKVKNTGKSSAAKSNNGRGGSKASGSNRGGGKSSGGRGGKSNGGGKGKGGSKGKSKNR